MEEKFYNINVYQSDILRYQTATVYRAAVAARAERLTGLQIADEMEFWDYVSECEKDAMAVNIDLKYGFGFDAVLRPYR